MDFCHISRITPEVYSLPEHFSSNVTGQSYYMAKCGQKCCNGVLGVHVWQKYIESTNRWRQLMDFLWWSYISIGSNFISIFGNLSADSSANLSKELFICDRQKPIHFSSKPDNEWQSCGIFGNCKTKWVMWELKWWLVRQWETHVFVCLMVIHTDFNTLL